MGAFRRSNKPKIPQVTDANTAGRSLLCGGRCPAPYGSASAARLVLGAGGGRPFTGLAAAGGGARRLGLGLGFGESRRLSFDDRLRLLDLLGLRLRLRRRR